MLLIAGPGSGVEEVLEILARLNLRVVDADDIARQLMLKGSAAYREIVDLVGGDCLDREGELDTFKVSQATRAGPRLAQQVAAIRSRAVRDDLERALQEPVSDPIFIRTRSPNAYGLRNLARATWRVSAQADQQVAALMKNEGWQRDSAQRFVRAQSFAGDEQAADLVLDTGTSQEALHEAVLSAVYGLEPQLAHFPFDAQDETQPVTEAKRVEASAEDRIGMEAESAAPVLMKDSEAAAECPEEASPPDQLQKALGEAPVSPAMIAPSAPTMPEQPTAGSPTAAGRPSLGYVELRILGRRVLDSLLILLAIGFMTSWGLILAQHGREGTPAPPLAGAWEALTALVQYLVSHPAMYFLGRSQVPWFQEVSAALGHSAGLLLLSMVVALLLGLPLGIAAARARYRIASAITVVISVLGASTPSFLFAMLLWVVNIWVHQATGLRVLPATGFGWDSHLVMPTLVLAMRPLAQIAQITYVTLRDALKQDFARTAYAKGLAWRRIFSVHLLRNILIPILNTLGSSLRFSLSSLPVIELFFHWPGVGSTLLDAINAGIGPLVMDLTLSLGLFFLVVNLVLEFFFPLIDPRLSSTAAEARLDGSESATGWMKTAGELVRAWIADLRRVFKPLHTPLPPLSLGTHPNLARPEHAVSRTRVILRSALGNPVLILGAVMIASLVALAIFGGRLETTTAYQVHGVMRIDGAYSAPPFKPSSIFPWGTDNIGRDIQALVLAGAGRTLSLAFYGMLARLAVGAILGLLAGWQRGGQFDRLVTGAVGIWAAFPATVFAMIVIQALGIQQGMWVFILAISFVGWGEVAQFVRGQVISLSSSPFIESARSIGARVDQILLRHILPNLVNPLVVLAALEMGGILVLLAELGFLNVFMGGGFRVMTGETGSMAPIIAFYSDVPEWSALIANVREQWRSHTWMALYPGWAIFLAIMAFNLFGEGLRRFLEDAAISLSRLFTRRGLVLLAGIGVAVALVLSSSSPLSTYRAESLKFDQAQVLEDIRVLSSPELQGRETGLPGADLAAIYIAQRMAQIGIFPAGERHGYYQRLVQPRRHLLGLPSLALLDDSSRALKEFDYRAEFREISFFPRSRGQAQGRVMGVAYGPPVQADSTSEYGLGNSSAVDHVIIVRAGDLSKVISRRVKAVLVIADAPAELNRRDVYPYRLIAAEDERPYLLITEEVADLLLRTAGSSLQQLDAARTALGPGQVQLTGEGMPVSISLPVGDSADLLNEAYLNVIGVIPGQGHFMGMEDQVIVVSAYYDGLGTDPQGVVFSGANDNASGVALMLELARLLKTSAYQPDKTVLFVAWAGGERQEGLSTSDILNARPGANQMTVEALIELSGVGAGTGSSLAIGNDSSYRMIQLFQKAAGRYGVRTTTRGRGPHYGLPTPRILGGREAMTLSVSWDGSDQLAHTPQDSFAAIDPGKLRQAGQSTYLTLLVLARESEY